MLDIETQFDYESDQSLASTSTVCRTILRRADSNISTQEKDVVKKDLEKVLHHGPVELTPGKNTIILRGKVGLYL